MSLFKYCNLCYNSTSHQLVFKQVPCTAFTTISLAFTVAWFMLECSSNKVCCGTKTLSHPWRPYKLARSRSQCTRKSWGVSALASRVISTELFPPFCTFSAKSSLVRENLSSQIPRFIRLLQNVSHFPAICLISSNKSWNLIGCCVLVKRSHCLG